MVGHGSGVHENATDALTNALSKARRGTPRLYAKNLKNLILG
jgi:ribosomal protein S30